MVKAFSLITVLALSVTSLSGHTLENIIILFGPPGSGKGSISQYLVKEYGCAHLSIGELCRKHEAEGTSLGLEIKTAKQAGHPPGDKLVAHLVIDRLRGVEVSNVVLDGYPRTSDQAQFFNTFLTNSVKYSNFTIIKLSASDSTLISRLSDRLICQNSECQSVYSTNSDSILAPKTSMVCDKCLSPLVRRVDDDPSHIEKRIADYHDREEGFVRFYSEQGFKIHEIDVDQDFAEVLQECLALIEI